MKICPLFYATQKEDENILTFTNIAIDRLEKAECLYRDCQWYELESEKCVIFRFMEVLRDIAFYMGER